MKRLFTGVFGGFCIMIACIGIYNYIHFNRLHEIQEELVQIDRIAQLVQTHKEEIKQLEKHQELFDSINKYTWSHIHANELFWTGIERALLTYCENREKTFATCGTNLLLSEITDLRRRERVLIKNAGEIGFKEYGLIGRLRTVAHDLERNYPAQKTRLLSLRRHEKDFLMRIEEQYAQKLMRDIEDWKKATSIPEKVALYQQIFDTLALRYLDLFSGKSQSSVASWDGVIENLQKLLRIKRTEVLQASFAQSKHAGKTNLLTNCAAVILAFSCTIFFVRRFSKQVIGLQRTMEHYIASNYQDTDNLMLKMPRNEFGKITMHFLQLTRKIKSDVQFLEDRVARRTQALERKNLQLEKQHIEITDSLTYARDLQQSFLVSRSQLLRSFADAHVLYQPKDLVGGDFYWMKTVKKPKTDLVYFALADCTGHGVPGALLSIMGMNALDELIDSQVYSPAELLNELRDLVRRRLNSDTDKRYDGMDMALFCWDKRTNTLQFAGAQMPLWLVRNDRIIEIEGQRMPIGYTFFEVNAFTDQSITLLPADNLVLFSDGVTDQFGGLMGKKAGKKRLREWVLQSQQELLFSRLTSQIESWKGKNEQTDDCTLIVLSPVKKQVQATANSSSFLTENGYQSAKTEGSNRTENSLVGSS